MDTYEKKYNEALERARNAYQNIKPENTAVKAMLEEAFPELRESEEERIRKALIDFFQKKVEKCFEWVKYGIPNNAVLAYLEKQKEQKPAEWSDKDMGFLYEVMTMVQSRGGWVRSDDAIENVKSWLNALPKRFNLQPKQEWSEEVETNLDRAINIVEDAKGVLPDYQTDDGIYECEKAIAVLREIAKNGHAVTWNDKDRQNIEKLIEILPQCIFRHPHIIDRDECRDLISWLKSLRPQSHWKPSDEQMEALKEVLETYKGFEEYDAMKSLYNDLKKQM